MNDIIAAIARCIDADYDDNLCELEPICDALIAIADDIKQTDANTIMLLARLIDPTESNFAAEIRNTMRDNNFNDLTIN